MKKRLIIIVVAVVVLITLGITMSLYSNSRNKINTGVRVFISPSEATVYVGEELIKRGEFGGYELDPGSYNFSFSYPGFDDQNKTVVIYNNQITDVYVKLLPNTEIAKNLINTPEESVLREEIATRLSEISSANLINNYPVVKLLPVITASWRIDYGISQKQPNNSEIIALYVTTDSDLDRETALKWLESQGYSRSSFEIIYRYFDELANPIFINP